jgi:hypothetical protein
MILRAVLTAVARQMPRGAACAARARVAVPWPSTPRLVVCRGMGKKAGGAAPATGKAGKGGAGPAAAADADGDDIDVAKYAEKMTGITTKLVASLAGIRPWSPALLDKLTPEIGGSAVELTRIAQVTNEPRE